MVTSPHGRGKKEGSGSGAFIYIRNHPPRGTKKKLWLNPDFGMCFPSRGSYRFSCDQDLYYVMKYKILCP